MQTAIPGFLNSLDPGGAALCQIARFCAHAGPCLCGQHPGICDSVVGMCIEALHADESWGPGWSPEWHRRRTACSRSQHLAAHRRLHNSCGIPCPSPLPPRTATLPRSARCNRGKWFMLLAEDEQKSAHPAARSLLCSPRPCAHAWPCALFAGHSVRTSHEH